MFGGPYDGVGGCLEGLMMGLVGVWRATGKMSLDLMTELIGVMGPMKNDSA